MTAETKKDYPVFDHDKDGHAAPDIEPGRVYYDEEQGRVICSEHGDVCATDGSMTRQVTEAQIGRDEDGQPFLDQSKQKVVGDAKLYKCTVCGQGTWSHQA